MQFAMFHLKWTVCAIFCQEELIVTGSFLKRKLSYRGHVLFEPVRPDVVKLALYYLKQNNFLYNNINNMPVDLLCLDEIPVVREVDIQEGTEL